MIPDGKKVWASVALGAVFVALGYAARPGLLDGVLAHTQMGPVAAAPACQLPAYTQASSAGQGEILYVSCGGFLN